MLLGDLTFKDAVGVAEHLKAIGETRISLREDADDLPWSLVIDVEAGSLHRLSGPVSLRFIASHKDSGLTFTWGFDLEPREANGAGVHKFDTARIRNVMRKLPPKSQDKMRLVIRNEILPGVTKLVDEIQSSLNKQQDIEASLRSLTA